MTNGPVVQVEHAFFRWFLVNLIFFGIPLLFCFQEYSHIQNRKEQNQRTRMVLRLEKFLGHIAGKSDSKRFMENVLREVSFKLSRMERRSEIRALLFGLKQRFPTNLDFLFLDRQGNIISELSTETGDPRLLRLFFRDFSLQETDRDSSGMNRDWEIISPFFGPLLRASQTESNYLCKSSTHPRRNQVFFTPIVPCGMGLFFVHKTPDWDSLAVRCQIQAFNKKSRETRLGFFHLERKTCFCPRLFPSGKNNLDRALAEMSEDPTTSLQRDGVVWCWRLISPTIRLFAATRPETPFSIGFLFAGIGFIGFGMFAWWTWVLMVRLEPWHFSIRLRMALLFSFTAGVPIILTVFAARDYAVERRTVLEDRYLNDLEASLRLFDNHLPHLLGKMETSLLRLISGLQGSPMEGFREKIIRVMGKVRENLDPSCLWITDESGELVGENHFPPSPDVKASVQLGKTGYINLLRRINGQEPKATDVQQDVVTEAAAAGGINIEEFFAGILQTRGAIRPLIYGEQRSTGIFLPLFDEEKTARFAAILTWNNEKIEQRYVDQFLFRMPAKNFRGHLFARRRWDGKTVFSGKPRFSQTISSLFHKLSPERPIVKQRWRVAEVDPGFNPATFFSDFFPASLGPTYLFCAIRGVHLFHIDLGAFLSDSPIRAELETFWKEIRFLCLFLLLLTFVAGKILTEQLLRPIGHFAQGMIAIRDRQFRQEIPVESQDELGLLSRSFNEMLAGFEDLEVARVIQETIFPSNMLEMGHLKVYGTCHPAAKVGGDYFDYFPLGSERVVVLIGDVSGHGAGAAMVVSMVKALTAHPALTWNPGEVLTTLNGILWKTLRRKKIMSLALWIFDTSSEKFQFSNAGQSDPILVRNDKSDYLISRGMVLGGGSRSKYQTVEGTLLPGDTIIFYTDGLPESRTRDGTPIGYDRLIQSLPGLVGASPKDTEENCRGWHQSMALPGPQDDDITLVALQYDKPEETLK